MFPTFFYIYNFASSCLHHLEWNLFHLNKCLIIKELLCKSNNSVKLLPFYKRIFNLFYVLLRTCLVELNQTSKKNFYKLEQPQSDPFKETDDSWKFWCRTESLDFGKKKVVQQIKKSPINKSSVDVDIIHGQPKPCICQHVLSVRASPWLQLSTKLHAVNLLERTTLCN